MATTIKPTLAKTPEVCVQIRQEIAATAKIEHAESSLISYNVPNTPSGHNRPTVLQEGRHSPNTAMGSDRVGRRIMPWLKRSSISRKAMGG